MLCIIIKDRSLIVFAIHPGENCYRISCVQASVVGYLDVTGRATRELI